MSTTEPGATALPLVAGQRLGRAEFHERYEAMPQGVRVELIGGVVYMPSPVGASHSFMTSTVNFWLRWYRSRTPGLNVTDNATTALGDDSEVQPDAALLIAPECGGRSRIVRNIIVDAPELVVEVAHSTRGLDLGAKRLDYERAGTPEYVVVTLEPAEVVWHARRDGRLERVGPGEDGIYRSEDFPGLWLDPAALFDHDDRALLAALDRGLATAEHAAFVDRLARARG